MSQPICPIHPKGRVRRQGRYGKNRQYQRWQCMPDNGDAPHLCRPIFPMKSMHGADGDFFGQLPGQPVYVVCDRQAGMLNALAKVWQDTVVYPCTQHLRMNVEEIIRLGQLRDEFVARLVHEKTLAFEFAASCGSPGVACAFGSTSRRSPREEEEINLSTALP